jgi:hypothetical protein
VRIVSLALISLVASCSSKSTSCPNAEELMRGSDGASRKEADIVVAACKRDNWSAAVTKCLREAMTAEAGEPCFKQLTADQQKKLKQAFEPVTKELAATDKAELLQLDARFGRDLEQNKVSQLATRGSRCKDYLAAIEAGRKTTRDCELPTGELEMFSFQKLALKQLTELGAITDDAALDAACVEKAAKLTEQNGALCKK